MLAKEKSIEIVFGLIKKYKEMVKSGEYPNLEPIKLHIEEIMLDIIKFDPDILYAHNGYNYLAHEVCLARFNAIIDLVLNDPKASLLQDQSGRNAGMLLTFVKDQKNVIKALNNPQASLQQDKYGINIGMYAAINFLQDAVLEALNNKDASTQQDNMGCNIGMYAATYGLEYATIKSLDNYEASIQQDNMGNNIGMIAANSKLENAVIKSMENDEAFIQINKHGQSIASLSSSNGLINAKKCALNKLRPNSKGNAFLARLPSFITKNIFNCQPPTENKNNILPN